MADLRPKTAPTVTLTGDAREATDDRPARRVDDRVGVAPGEQVGLPTGHRLADRYVIRRPIGVGGFGTVYEAEDTRLTKPVAVKVLNRSAATRHQIGRFHREAIAASQIGHPGIINVTDFGQDDDTNFMVMELLEGAELSELCERRGTLPPLEALEIVRDIAEAVGAAHREQILHRDLKPSNVFVTGSRRLKVIDFGIAKILADHLEVDGMTFEGQVMGTAEYMAPEQARGDADLDARVDVYALGVILFELVTGERPFSADSVAALMEAHRLAPTPLASERAPELAGAAAIDGLCARALAKDRDERFEGMQAFVRAIDEARASLRQGERRDGHAGRRRVTPARVALLLLALAALGWWGFKQAGTGSASASRRANAAATPPLVVRPAPKSTLRPSSSSAVSRALRAQHAARTEVIARPAAEAKAHVPPVRRRQRPARRRRSAKTTTTTDDIVRTW